MKQVHPETPSLSQLKSISIPGYVPPKKVKQLQSFFLRCFSVFKYQYYSSLGLPFYVNLPELAVSRSIGDPTVSAKIRRHPVEIKEHEAMRYIDIN